MPGNHTDDDGNGYVDDVHGVNLSADGSTRDLRDQLGHGTHVAGTIAAAANGRGVIGVANRAKLMTVKVLDARGAGSTAAIAAGIRYAAANGARIINLSLETADRRPARARGDRGRGGGQRARRLLGRQRRPPTSIGEPLYPVAIPAPNLVGVAATAPADDGLAMPDVLQLRPRSACPSPRPARASLSTASDGGYESRSGTSMAAPHVAGVAALVASVAPRPAAAELRGLLLEHAVRARRRRSARDTSTR